MKRNASVFVILCIAILAMVASGKYLSRSRQNRSTITLPGDIRGVAAPDFELTSLDGKRMKLSDFRGKAVLLNFWATWCSPCKVEMPWFVDLQKKYGSDGLVVVGVAMDDTETSKIAKFTSEIGVNYPILLGTDQVSEDYGNVQYLPTSFYIDREGRLVAKGTGLLGREEIEQNIQKALAAHVAGASEPKGTSAPRDAAKQQPTVQ